MQAKSIRNANRTGNPSCPPSAEAPIQVRNAATITIVANRTWRAELSLSCSGNDPVSL